MQIRYKFKDNTHHMTHLNPSLMTVCGSNIASGEIEMKVAAGIIARNNSASKKKDDEATK